MNNIEWKNGAVCYADGEQRYAASYISNKLMCGDLDIDHYGDFQLNEPRQGDYIPKSELDTEQKYNDAIEVFGLFGCVRNSAHAECKHLPFYEYLKVSGTSVIATDNKGNRKLTYNQLMAIGKLKRLMNERDNLKRWGEYSRCVKVDLGAAKTIESCCGGSSVGYECSTSEKPNGCEKPKLATQYLNECIEVQKHRGEQYDSTGTGERSFAAAASAFNAITGKNLKGSDVCLLLTCVKAVRQYSNPNRLHEDSLLDGVSYLSLWAEELNKELK